MSTSRASRARSSGISSLAVPTLYKNEDEMHHIYSGWAMYFFIRDPEKTEYCFSKCLELNQYDANSLYLRSASKRDVARFESALEDALAATRYHKNRPQYDFEVCENYNHLKNFEKAKAELHNNLRKYLGANATKFGHSLEVVNQYLKDCLGPALEVFIKKHKKLFPEVLDSIEQEKAFDPRPLWKIQKELGKCDVVSVDEKQKDPISPLERARRERWYRIFNQIYFGRNWVDKVFLRDLTKIDKYLPPIFLESSPLLKELIDPQNEAVKKFIKILHARSPLYVEQSKRFASQKLLKKHTENFLFQQQYQARRKIFNVLRAIKNFRKLENIEGMSNYIEEVMGDYVTTKTNRIMPRKFEFINEVYNMLALAHADWYIKADKKQRFRNHPKNRLQRMFGVDSDGKIRTGFVFGDRSTYVPADAIDPTLATYKVFLERIEKRLSFAKYPIEKAYLWHEIARAHFKKSHFGECHTAAIRAVEAAKSCNSIIWTFLSQMLIVKSFVAEHKVEYAQAALNDVTETVQLLKNSNLINFVETAASITSEDIDNKRSTTSIEFNRRKTLGSMQSQAHRHSSDDTRTWRSLSDEYPFDDMY